MSERSDSESMIRVERIYQVTSGLQAGEDTGELLSELIRAYSTDLYNLAFSYVHNVQQAEDLTQETFIRAYRNLDRFHGRSSYKTWLYSIASNCCRDYLRAQKVRRLFLLSKAGEPLQTAVSAESEAIAQVEGDAIWSVVMKLPLHYREIIILHYKEDLSLAQISEILSVSEQTLRTRVFRAREKLKKLMQEEGIEWISGKRT